MERCVPLKSIFIYINFFTMQKALTIKLISPAMSLRPMDTELKRRMSPSMALVTLATLTPPPHKASIEDENVHAVNFSDSPDLVGITVNVDTRDRAIEIAKQYRKRGIKVIMGGIHASACPDELTAHCDAVCIGEAEEIWVKILNDASENNLQPRYMNADTTSMDNFPAPNWEYISKKDYLYHNVVTTSRGCPFHCEFCYNSCDYIRNPYRNRPVSKVIDEIKQSDFRQIMFIDDNLLGSTDWLREFLPELKKLRIIWHGAVSANIIYHSEIIELMSDSGCRSLFIGFESIHHDSLQSVKKFQNKTSDYERLIKLLHEHGIMVNSSLVFGFDHDTRQTFDQTLEWLIQNKVESMTSHILTPYPGTKLYKKLNDENRIIENDLRKYNTSNVVFQPKNMTPEELRHGYLGIYEKFYSLKSIIQRRPLNYQLIAPYLMFNFGYRKFGKLTAALGKMGLMSKIGNLARKLSYGID